MEKGLTQVVVEATGLPENPVANELQRLMSAHGTNADELTLDQLRVIMAEYLNEVFLELASEDEIKSA